MPFQLGLDVWEGDPNLDEATLKAAGVSFLLIRMNETLNRERLDYNFKKQWSESAGFLRGAYVVFGDWLTVESQVKFIIDNRPNDCHLIALDVECDANTIDPVKVAGDLCEMVRQLRGLGLHVVIYSGAWWWKPARIQTGLPWQSAVDYWWASYPVRFQPDNSRKSISWDALKALISGWTWNTGMAPGPCQLRQVCSRYILPGTGGLNVDINLFNGTPEQLEDYFGGTTMPEPIPDGDEFTTFTVSVNVASLNVRSGPGTNYPIVGKLSKDSVIRPVLAIGGTDLWVQIAPGQWAAVTNKGDGVTYQIVKSEIKEVS